MVRMVLVVAVVGGVGCGTSSSTSQTPVEIIGRDWTVPPGTETYKCIGIQVDHDMYIHDFKTLNPFGEHHTVLTVTDQLGGLGHTMLGEYDCSVLTLDLQMLFASGVGTGELAMPDGIGLEVKAGQYLNLNLHLFNTTDQPVSGHSGIVATMMDPVDPAHQAEMIFAGTTNISIPPGATQTIGGGCTFGKDATLFTYWPHMHQHATHQTVTLTQGGVATKVHDADFNFMEQANYPLTPMIQIHAGDAIRTDCTYTNNDATTLTFGDSSTAEMCFTGLYRYPKQALSLFECTQGR